MAGHISAPPTIPATPQSSILRFGALIGATTLRAMSPYGTAADPNWAPNTRDARVRVPFACTLRNMYTDLGIGTPHGAGINVDYIVRVNGADPAQQLSCNIGGAAQESDTDLVTVMTLAAGDQVEVLNVTGAGVPGDRRTTVHIEMRPL